MDRTAGVGLAAYAALVASLATPIYDPLFAGDDDWWGVAVVAVAAHVGLGVAVGRVPVRAMPGAFSVALFGLGGAEELAWTAIFVVLPALVVLSALGLALRRFPWIAVPVFAVAALPLLWAGNETVRRAERVPASLERQLPIELSLGNLCPGASTEPQIERRLRRQTRVLIRELGRRPNDLVIYTYYDADSADEDRREITLRELAQEQLSDLEAGGRNCAPELQQRIRAAL